MGDRKRPAGTVEVEHLSFDEWAAASGPPPTEAAVDESVPPPARPERSGLGRLGPNGTRIAAVVAALAVIGGTVAIATGSSTPSAKPATTTASTRPPATTAPRPVETAAPTTTTVARARAPKVDVRVALADPPEGFVPSYASQNDEADAISGTVQLFAADGATWDTGPWALILTGAVSAQVAFDRPPVATTVGTGRGWVGHSAFGDEMTTFDPEPVAIATRGMAPGSGATIGAAVMLDGSTVSVPATAVPGMRPIEPGPVATRLRVESTPTGMAGYANPAADTYLQLTAVAHGSETTPFDWAFFLSDLRYATIDGWTAIGGTTADGRALLTWTTSDRTITITGDGLTVDDLVRVAPEVVMSTDAGWSEELWSDAVAGNPSLVADASWDAPVEVQAAIDPAIDWAFEAAISDRDLYWQATRAGGGSGIVQPLDAAPLSVIASTGRRPGDFSIIAFALAGAGTPGMVLRLTTDGATVDVPLHPASSGDERFAPYVLAGDGLPWTTGGWTVQLLDAAGNVLAVETDADSP